MIIDDYGSDDDNVFLTEFGNVKLELLLLVLEQLVVEEQVI